MWIRGRTFSGYAPFWQVAPDLVVPFLAKRFRMRHVYRFLARMLSVSTPKENPMAT